MEIQYKLKNKKNHKQISVLGVTLCSLRMGLIPNPSDFLIYTATWLWMSCICTHFYIFLYRNIIWLGSRRSDNFRPWSILKASRICSQGELWRLWILMSFYFCSQASHQLCSQLDGYADWTNYLTWLFLGWCIKNNVVISSSLPKQ